jgi:hypothetical protein
MVLAVAGRGHIPSIIQIALLKGCRVLNMDEVMFNMLTCCLITSRDAQHCILSEMRQDYFVPRKKKPFAMPALHARRGIREKQNQ